MAHRPEFDNDVFISYAHIDNAPLRQGQKGWVEQFHSDLKTRLAQLLGRELLVDWDQKLEPNVEWRKALLDRLSRIAVLVSILSPRYLQSDWCRTELREFVTRAERTWGLRMGDRARVFKVVKTFVDRDRHPPELQGMLGYEFYQLDPMRRGRPREFPPESDSYWDKLEDLAYDIRELLKEIEDPPEDIPSPRDTIYLAEATLALDPERQSIWRELRQRGYRILPDRPLPLEAAALRAAVREQLDQAQLSIHLVGPSYGVVPDGESRSVVSIQLDVGANGAAPGPRQRLIWLPPGLTPADDRQRAFVAALHDDYAGRPGVELLQGSLEDFKTFVQDRLTRRTPAPPPTRPVSRRVYVMCDARDLERVRPIEDHLYHAGFEVTLPAGDGDVSELRQDHEANLVDSDGVLVFWGQGNETWLRSMVRALSNAGAYGRTGPFLAKAVYVADPATEAKERYRSHDLGVVRGPGAFEPTRLADFVAALQARPSASP
jgi:hypothetical protein